MSSIDEIIKREVNPFDLVNLRVGNFWTDNQDSNSIVESIHQDAISEIERFLDLVAMDNRSRTILLIGDSGSGKSYLLGRLKHTFNPKAFFAYISPWADNDYIWRHVLRHTVNSLIQIPEGQQESQLILWLKNLSAFTQRSFKERIFNDSIWNLLHSDRKKFVKHLKDTYKQAGIYHPDIFFGVLHDLTNPELYPSACEWLRGDDLSEESMQELKVKHCIDTEDAAKNVLANFGKITTATQPIVLCFDQVETSANWNTSPYPIFNINTTIHNDNLKNLLIIISIVKDPWRQSINLIPQSDKARIEREVSLKPINLTQAEALWTYRLKSIHQEANPQPNTPIYPLNRPLLEENFPGGKTFPRNTFILGRQEYEKYKLSLLIKNDSNDTLTLVVNQPQTKGKQKPETKEPLKIKISKPKDTVSPKIPPIDDRERMLAEFKILWEQEYKKIQAKTSKISLLSSSDLIRMLQEALEALQLQSVKPKLISGKNTSYSLSFQDSSKRKKIGVVWTEDANMNSFNNVMNACHKAIQENLCGNLYLIRIGNVGHAKLAGYQKYQQIFSGTQHHHIKPNLADVHDLATYYNLVNSALAQELVIAGNTINLQELQSLIRETEILHKCTLLQDLGVVPKQKPNGGDENAQKDLRRVKDFLLNVVKTQGYMGVSTLISQTASQFSDVKETDIQHLVDLLCQERKVKIINPKDKLQDQLICLVT
ncbi:MAG: ATP-binding protein [Heteroscytonema crispum UTEX LB 1556]